MLVAGISETAVFAFRVLEAADLLRSYALSRGWVAASGLPDETRSGRQILKDFVNGKLLHCERPPACSLSNTQLGLTGQNITPSKRVASPQAMASDTAETDQAEARINGDSRSESEGASDSASEPDGSSDLGENGAQSSLDGSAAADDAAAVSSSSDTEAAAAAHTARLSDADRELMESMSNVQGGHGR